MDTAVVVPREPPRDNGQGWRSALRVMLCLVLVLPFAVVSAHAVTGRATVTGQGAQCPAQYAGTTENGYVAGMTHANCTAAKNIARANLRARVPAGCARYITSTARCSPP